MCHAQPAIQVNSCVRPYSCKYNAFLHQHLPAQVHPTGFPKTFVKTTGPTLVDKHQCKEASAFTRLRLCTAIHLYDRLYMAHVAPRLPESAWRFMPILVHVA